MVHVAPQVFCSLVTLDVVVVSSTSESCKNLLRLQNQPLEEVRVLNGWAWKQNLCGETVMLETSPDHCSVCLKVLCSTLVSQTQTNSTLWVEVFSCLNWKVRTRSWETRAANKARWPTNDFWLDVCIPTTQYLFPRCMELDLAIFGHAEAENRETDLKNVFFVKNYP